MLRFSAMIIALMAVTAPPVAAQNHSSMEHGEGGHSQADQSASTAAFQDAMDTMHEEMMIDYTGNPDIDFMRGMIPHHQGAIDMARIVLEHGKDPEVRKLAEDVIKAQEGEIEMMREWLKENDTAK
ncbi:CopM family metallochaperone [Paracoccus alkanivorans]|uniref:DUF305 domain-containing protein n=1 Tax=Paracoccus alkanivorans TaxID=2116655 RepID=A0A3M0M444_9RHOB|nr:DUF305 domain-containing protein [Paracoccus alkanivorans]RMC31983.1 DUF305 domain-containing protein [Paracoccus alkanivorans]